ncbi:response regulator [Pseudoclavibacter helvolus]|uniref:response regulator n=1 Tax=Pseudoclavibacter helvolus TaxID=255205 RepID=UPI003C736C17
MAAAPFRILIIEDDADVAEFLATVLRRRLGCEIRVLGDALTVQVHVQEFVPDLVLTDVELPGMSGLEVLGRLREIRPDLPVVVMTAHASVEYAVRALRERADEFLQKPIASALLVSTVQRLVEEARVRRALTSQRRVLAIGAHPDDVEIGVGGTLAAHAAAGDSIVILTLSRGGRGGDVSDRQHESLASADSLGARLFLEDLTDTAIPNSDPTVGIIERVIAETDPNIVYTHSKNDRHQDHRAVHEATLVASRRVATVACYQSPSSTIDFRPTKFVTVDGYTEAKLGLLARFASQAGIRDYLEPDYVLSAARYWSRFGSGTYSEPLEVIRDASSIAPDRGAGEFSAASHGITTDVGETTQL